MEVLVPLFLLPALAYLLGSIPVGLVLTRLFGYGDIRAIGSGNIGATNVLRTGNKQLAALTLILDAGKGAVAAGLPTYWMLAFGGGAVLVDQTLQALCLLAAVIGHCFPLWLGFKGGKGVATLLGAMLTASPLSALLFIVLWPLTALVFRYSSLAALVALMGVSVLNISLIFILSDLRVPVCLSVIAASAVVIYRHKDNIKRLMAGAESKIGQKHG